MNYDKQKPLTQEEIDCINSKNNICVVNIRNYPKGYIHTEIAWDLPITITRNEDGFWFNNYTESNKDNYWVVYPDDDSEKSLETETKQFKDISKALNYAITAYEKWLKNRLSYLEKFD